MRIIISLLFLLTTLFFGQPANASEPVSQPASQPIVAPTAQLTYDSPSVTTSPAPQPAPQVVIPAQPAPSVGVPQPRCEEDMPCWEGSPNDNRYHAQPERCEEDMDCWDCTMGINPCGSTIEDDALATFTTTTGLPIIDDTSIVTYVSSSTERPSDLALTEIQITLPSVNLPNVWHVLEYRPLSHA